MTDNDESVITRLAIRHSVSPDAVRTILRALRSGGGMAQFSHPDFGGMSQWSSGMTMVGDMFNSELKSKLDAICTELAAYLARSGPSRPDKDGGDAGVSYRSNHISDWWPDGLGIPGSVGAQNNLRYAVFPVARRLAIKDGRAYRHLRHRRSPDLRSSAITKHRSDAHIHQSDRPRAHRRLAKGRLLIGSRKLPEQRSA